MVAPRKSAVSHPLTLIEELLAARNAETAAGLVARRIAGRDDVVQVRVWLVRRGDRCESCAVRSVCPARDRCLHLVALEEGELDGVQPTRSSRVGRMEGASPRFPIGVGKLGKVAESGTGDLSPDLRRDPSWRKAGEWIRREGIRGFVLEPMISEGVVRGVIGVFSRTEAHGSRFHWLRPIADAAGAATSLHRRLSALERDAERRGPARGRAVPSGNQQPAQPEEVRTEAQMREDERGNIVRALELTRWRVYGPDGAAALLGLRPTTLASRIRKMAIRRPPGEPVGE